MRHTFGQKACFSAASRSQPSHYTKNSSHSFLIRHPSAKFRSNGPNFREGMHENGQRSRSQTWQQSWHTAIELVRSVCAVVDVITEQWHVNTTAISTVVFRWLTLSWRNRNVIWSLLQKVSKINCFWMAVCISGHKRASFVLTSNDNFGKYLLHLQYFLLLPSPWQLGNK